MRGRGRSLVLAGLATALAVVPAAAAQAATKNVTAGPPPSAGKKIGRYAGEVNDYFQHKVTIHVGDSVRWTINGFHDIDLPAKGKRSQDLLVPQGTVSGVNDAAGQPFWFNGLPGFATNFALVLRSKAKTYDGRQSVTSGLPLGKPSPFKVTFTKKGTFRYYCDIHPGMVGIVRVLPRGAKGVPSRRRDAEALKAQVASALRAAKALAKLAGAAKTNGTSVRTGLAGKNGVEYFGFAPRILRVKVGTTVNFSMPTRSFEAHTASFGADPVKKGNYLFDLANSFQAPAPDPRAVYPSDRPGSVVSFGSTTHGNGFWSTGLIDAVKTTPPGSSGRVSFAEKGTFDYYCLIHPFMHGQVVVE